MNDVNKKYFLDTNIFLRVLIPENEEMFLRSSLFLQKIKEGEIQAYTSSFVLTEINWVLRSYYKYSKQKCISAVESILSLPNLKITSDHEIRNAISLAKENNIKFVDAILASHIIFEGKNAILISYDKEFDRLSIKREEP